MHLFFLVLMMMTKRFEKKGSQSSDTANHLLMIFRGSYKVFSIFSGKKRRRNFIDISTLQFLSQTSLAFCTCIVAYPNLATMEGTTLVFYDTHKYDFF